MWSLTVPSSFLAVEKRPYSKRHVDHDNGEAEADSILDFLVFESPSGWSRVGVSWDGFSWVWGSFGFLASLFHSRWARSIQITAYLGRGFMPRNNVKFSCLVDVLWYVRVRMASSWTATALYNSLIPYVLSEYGSCGTASILVFRCNGRRFSFFLWVKASDEFKASYISIR